jgi:hypothetical protein
MPTFAQKRELISKRISKVVNSPTPLKDIAKGVATVARTALAEPNTITVENVSINLRRLPEQLDGLRIVHLSDIHHSPFTNLQHINRAVEIANNLQPDIIALTGDYVSHEAEYVAPVADALGKLAAKHGVFAVMGNHDHWTDGPLVSDLFKTEGINVLNNEGFRFSFDGGTFWLAGVDDVMAGLTDLPKALKGAKRGEMKLLLAHNPALVTKAARAGVDLMLSGHTHGGQIKFGEITESARFPRKKLRLTSGLHRRGETQVYITRGIGTVVLPVRYGCPPEVSLLELRASHDV